MKISTRINLTFITTFFIILLITGLAVVYYTLNVFRSETFDNLYYGGRTVAEHVRTYINDQKKTGAILAAASVYRDFLKEATISAQYKVVKGKIDNRLTRTVQVDNDISEVFILDKTGKVAASSDKKQEGKDKSLDPYFINGQKEVFVKDIYLSETTKEINYTVSAPVKDEASNMLLGVSVVRYRIDSLNKILINYGESYKTKEAFLINKDRYFLTPSLFLGNSVVLNKIVNTDNAKQCFNQEEIDYVVKNGYLGLEKAVKKSQLVEDKDYRQVDVLATHNYIPETNWCLITKIDRSEFMIPLNLISLIFILALGLIFVILTPLGYWLSKRITKPIIDLSHGAEIVGKGNLNYKVGTDLKDEIGDLSREFDEMTQAIKQSRLEVDQKVKEQTGEIVKKEADMEEQQKAILNILEDVEGLNGDLEKFKMAVDNASDHIVITDLEGIILYANQAVETITGFDKSYVIGKKAGNKELWGGQMELSFYQKFWKIIKTDKKVFTGEVNNRRKGGEAYVAMASISPVLNSEKEVVYFVGIERDITHEKEVDRMKTDFISLASHQLRTPLSAMRWFSEMLLAGDAGKLTKEQKEYITNISLSNERMIDLVNSLLNISRIESGRIVIDPEPTDLEKLVADVLTEIDNKIKEKKQQVIISIHSSLPKIKVDPKLIREVYKNLLTNANKYTPVGGEISIFISKKDKEIISQISDNGLGIPPQSQAHVFEKFYRAENIVKLETEGTGLGLYLAKAIVESSKGKIWFKSQEKVGTTFWFTLPLVGVGAKKGEVTINS